ncbi:MAG TPA: HAMP domain-containing sensor histidine kinase [Puia sp.]|jgi:signal transduction histidine kinase|nr:HAMP domain-containing sensor histidine kinase [Puia sp.]
MRRIKRGWNILVFGGTEDMVPHDAQRRVIIGVNLMSLSVGILTITIGTFVWLITGRLNVLAAISIQTLLLTTPLLLNRIKRYDGASLSIYLIMSVATLYFGCILGEAVNSPLMITYLIGVSLFLFSGLPYRVICVSSSVAILVLIEVNYQYKFLPPIETGPQTRVLLKWSSYLAMIILVIITFHLFWRNNRALRKELQRHTDQIKANLERETQAGRNKDKFITNASHEMKVSFHSIFSVISVLVNDVQAERSAEQVLRRINDLKAACKISQSIVDNILEFEKYEAGIPASRRENLFNPKLLFQNTIEIYRYVAMESRIEIKTWISKEMPDFIQSDDIKIRHILTNLLHNAIKYAPDQSTVLVKCKVKDNVLQFSVHDKGEGIADGIDIFAPFVSKNPEGLGIGLFIVKEMVTILSGKVVVTSDEEGTTFSVSIPLHPVKHPIPAVSPHHN